MDYDKLIAPAAEAMRPSGIRKFFDLAAEMPECISLGVGEPDFKTPRASRLAPAGYCSGARISSTLITSTRSSDLGNNAHGIVTNDGNECFHRFHPRFPFDERCRKRSGTLLLFQYSRFGKI